MFLFPEYQDKGYTVGGFVLHAFKKDEDIFQGISGAVTIVFSKSKKIQMPP
jgi:hypothetical protein